MLSFEFLIPRRPVSVQTSSRESYQDWKRIVRAAAERLWTGQMVPRPKLRTSVGGVRLTLGFLCRESPMDVDNIVKPIQDALVGLVYADDMLVTDVESHRRFVSELLDLSRIPPLLRVPVLEERECVYVRVDQALSLEEYL